MASFLTRPSTLIVCSFILGCLITYWRLNNEEHHSRMKFRSGHDSHRKHKHHKSGKHHNDGKHHKKDENHRRHPRDVGQENPIHEANDSKDALLIDVNHREHPRDLGQENLIHEANAIKDTLPKDEAPEGIFKIEKDNYFVAEDEDDYYDGDENDEHDNYDDEEEDEDDDDDDDDDEEEFDYVENYVYYGQMRYQREMNNDHLDFRLASSEANET